MKQFYILQGETKKIHPLVSLEGVLVIEVPRALAHIGPPLHMKESMLVSVPSTVSMPLLPVYDYTSQEVKVVNQTLLMMAICAQGKEFLTHDFVITGNMLGLYLIETISTTLDPSWPIPTQEELKLFGEAYQKRKIAKLEELHNGE